MQISVEKTSDIGRKMTISIPHDDLDVRVARRLQEVASTVQMQGFRKGKAPLNRVREQYGDRVRDEVARDLIGETFEKALLKEKLVPIGRPNVDILHLEENHPFQYTAEFEILPEAKVGDLAGVAVELIQSEIEDVDVDALIEKMRKEYQNWKPVARKVKDGDKIIMDFEGFLDDTPFEGGKATGHQHVVGSGALIPDFEKALVGVEKDVTFDANISFPKEYHSAELAGKKTRFTITVREIMEGELPPLDAEFFKKFNVDGDLKAFKADIRGHMVTELERNVDYKNRSHIFEEWCKKNPITLPQALIEQEIQRMMHDMYHRVFGAKHTDNEKIPDFPRELFEEDAKKRVHVALLFSQYVQQNGVTVDAEKLEAHLKKIAHAYDKPEEFIATIKADKKRMEDIESLIIEETVASRLIEKAKATYKKMRYDEVISNSRA